MMLFMSPPKYIYQMKKVNRFLNNIPGITKRLRDDDDIKMKTEESEQWCDHVCKIAGSLMVDIRFWIWLRSP